VTLPDGSTLRISERIGKPGEVGTSTKRVTTPGGEPPPPRVEEVAKSHGIAPANAATFEALYQAHPRETLAFLEALRGRPELTNRLLARFGESVLTHFKPTGGEMFDIHGEIEISAGKLDELGKRNVEDLGKLIELARNKGPANAYDYFETTSTTDNKPGARLRFRSRLGARAKLVVKGILDSLGINPEDARAKLFDSMTEGDATRLRDLFNERGYKDLGIRKQAVDWAFSKNPNSVREFVAEFQFYDAEVSNRADRYLAGAKAELTKEIANRKAANGGTDLSEAELRLVTREVTKSTLGRAFEVEGPAWGKEATRKAAEEMAEKLATSGNATTVGADAADAAWAMNMQAQRGADAAGAKIIGRRTDAELPGYLQKIADTLSFADDFDAAYHAHKHARELSTRPVPTAEMTTYLRAARDFVRLNAGTVRANQNGSRSVIYEADRMRAIVYVGRDGNAAIATFGKANQ
jgi:hypothetical protein